MKNRMKKLLVLATAATMMTAAFTGCGSGSDGADNNADTSADEGTSNENLNGSLSLAGSTSMEKLCEALKESFMEKNPGVTVTVEYTGSGSGIESVTAGSVDIGDSSIALTDDEKANGVEENIVAIDGIAVITDKDNSVTELTSDDLKKIYTGEISNWKDLGGKDEAIVAIGREAASGTRGAFEELLDVKDQCKYAQELDSTGAVLAKVGSTPGAIGYVSLDVLDDTVTAMKIDGVEATAENVKNGTYKVARPFNIATKSDISDVAQDFIDYILSSEGQEIVSDGYIKINDDAQPYAGSKPAGKIVVAGSSSVSPVMEKLKEAYLKVNTNAEIELQTSDSTAGMTGAMEGTCDIGMASRELKDSESATLTATPIALDGIAVIVNPQNPTDDMSTEDIKDIFTGTKTMWSEIA